MSETADVQSQLASWNVTRIRGAAGLALLATASFPRLRPCWDEERAHSGGGALSVPGAGHSGIVPEEPRLIPTRLQPPA